MLIVIAFIADLILAYGLIKQVQTIVARKRSFVSYLYKYLSLFTFIAVFYQNPDARTEIGIAFGVGTVSGLLIGIVAKQRPMR